MAQKYAKDQPAGFTNRIEKVAIVGAGGTIGSHVVKALLKTGKHEVTAISREGSTTKLPEGVRVARVDYDNEDSLVSALKGQQFLAISMAAREPGQQVKLINAAAKAGVPWVMPNAWGTDVANLSLTKENMTGAVLAGIDACKEAQGVSYIVMCCGFWYEFSVAQGPQWYGFDFKNKTMTFYDDGKTLTDTSTWMQVGRGVAALLSLKELPEDENDTSLTISNWRDKPLYINSFHISQREMFASVLKALGETEKDWTVQYEPSKERWQRGMDEMKSGNRLGFATAMYSRTFFQNGDGDLTKHGLANEVLGLPKESLDEASVRAVEMVKAGYNYMAR